MKASYLKPLLPLRDIVIFPSMVVPLFVGREKSIKALQEAMKSDKSIILVTQKNSEIDDPTSKDLYQYVLNDMDNFVDKLTLNELIEEVKYTLDEEFLDEMITTIKEKIKD